MREDINKLQISMATMEQKITNIEAMVAEIKDTLKTAENKFAAKWVEWIVKGMVAIVLLAVLWQVANFFIAKPGQVLGITKTAND